MPVFKVKKTREEFKFPHEVYLEFNRYIQGNSIEEVEAYIYKAYGEPGASYEKKCFFRYDFEKIQIEELPI